MRAETNAVESFTVYDASALDPITVVLQDAGAGSGRLFVECYGVAWAHYWGAMGERRIREFLLDTHPDYVTGKLLPYGDRRIPQKEEAYLHRIVTAVLDALHQNSSVLVSKE